MHLLSIRNNDFMTGDISRLREKVHQGTQIKKLIIDENPIQDKGGKYLS